jgi:hypothetical protein
VPVARIRASSEHALDFLNRAAPAAGRAYAVRVTRTTSTGTAVALGIALGAALGVALGNTAIGIAIGVAVGAAVGALVAR